VQELGRQDAVNLKTTALQRYPSDGKAFVQLDVGPAVQLISRDAFVSETAVKIDQMLAEMKSLGRELQLVKSDFAELKDEAAGNARFSQFLDREHKSRSVKLDELSRKFDYLKARFDAIDGNSQGDYQAFRTFEAVSRRLTELGALERDFRQSALRLKLSVGFFAAAILAWAGAVFAF